MTRDHEDLADRLEQIVADLDERSFDLLREASASGAGRRPDEDKRLTQARRAIEKAIVLLRDRAGDDE